MELWSFRLHDIDLGLFHLVNQWAGNWLLDRMAKYEERLDLLKGGMLLTLYWVFWFRPGPDQEDRKATILAAIAGALVGLIVNRTLAAALPFRVRPIYDPTVGAQGLSIPVDHNLEDWNAFPSDSATYFVALAVGFWFLWRPLGAVLLIWAVAYVCVPRVFMGIHYPSDLAAGALIGIVSVSVMQQAALKKRVARPVLALEQVRPGLFYPLMFLVSYELVVVFFDVRVPLRAMVHAARHYGVPLTGEIIVLLGVAACLLVAACVLALRTLRRPLQPSGKDAPSRLVSSQN